MANQNGAVLRPWTIKAMPEELTQRAVAAARRRQETVAELVSRALARELDGPSVVMRSDQIEPSKPPDLNPAGPGDVVRLAPLVASMPRWLRAALWRRVAGELGVEAPAGRARKALEGPR